MMLWVKSDEDERIREVLREKLGREPTPTDVEAVREFAPVGLVSKGRDVVAGNEPTGTLKTTSDDQL